MKRMGFAWLLTGALLVNAGCAKRQAPQPAEEDTPAARLHRAARQGELAQVQLLIAGGCDIEAKDKNGFTPLHTAVSSRQTTIVQLLISKGADVNTKTSLGGTALHLVAWNGPVTIAQLLIAAGADVNAGRENGRTPLYEAGHPLTDPNQRDVVELLLANGAEVLPGDTRENSSLLCFAVECGWQDLVEKLLAAGASPNAMGCGSGRTVLGEAVALGDTEIVKLLIAHGADVNGKDHWSFTPLHHARHWSREAAELLLTNGADINTTGAFRRAIQGSEKEIVELFLMHGADVSLKNYEGETPLEEAIRLGDREIAELLRKYGAK